LRSWIPLFGRQLDFDAAPRRTRHHIDGLACPVSCWNGFDLLAMLIGTDVESPGGPGRLRRWLRADLADLLDVSGPRDGVASARPGSDAGRASFEGDLRGIRRRVVRRWALAAAGRYALAALAVALVPALLAAFGAIGWIWAIVVPAALFVVALGTRLSRPPSLAAVARLLDDRLGLFDVTATALQVERAGEAVDEGPAAPVFAEAAALLRAGSSTWRPRTRLGSRELAAAGALVVALAAIAIVGSSDGGSTSTKVTATTLPPGLRHRVVGGPNSVSPPLVPPRARRKSANGPANGAKRHPYGIYDYGFEGKHKVTHFAQKSKVGLRYAAGKAPSSQQPQQQFSAPGVAEGNEAREKAEEEAANAGAKQGAQGKKEGGSEPPPNQSLKSLTGGAVPPSGTVSPVPNGNTGSRPPSSGQTAGSPSNSAAPGSRSAGSPNSQNGGRPSGSQSAGSQRAPLASGEKGSEGGGTGGELALKAGFAAVKSGKAASGRGPRNAQGAGGPGKSAGIGGSAFEEAEAGSLGYVPPDAGVAPSVDPGLFERYLNALAAIAGRRW
jgi:hypothetical protein